MKVIYFFTLCFLFVTGSGKLFAQEVKTVDFNNKFAVQSENLGNARVFVVNLDEFSNSDEVARFRELTFKDNEFVSIDAAYKGAAYYKVFNTEKSKEYYINKLELMKAQALNLPEIGDSNKYQNNKNKK